MTIQKSLSFVLPYLGVNSYKMLMNGLENTYMGIDSSWGEDFYLLFNKEELKQEFLEELKRHEYFLEERDLEDYLLLSFTIPDEVKETIVEPFLQGKYSTIDREYVKKHFPKYINGFLSSNWKILNKHPDWKAYWEHRIGVELPQGAEVWPKPEKEDEILKIETSESNT